MKLILTTGLPASGKTDWAMKFILKNPNFIRVSRDDLRNMRGKYWIPEQEDMISEWELFCVKEALDRGMSVIVDATNFRGDYNLAWEALAKIMYAELEFMSFNHVPVETCIARDAKRNNPVGADVINRMNNKYLKKNA